MMYFHYEMTYSSLFNIGEALDEVTKFTEQMLRIIASWKESTGNKTEC